jgi:hypothetical protein
MKCASVVLAIGWLLVGLAPAADSLNVRLVGSCSMPGVYGVGVAGDCVYAADGGQLEPDTGGALRVVDVSDPHAPAQVGYCNLSGFALNVAVVGNLAYVAAYDGLHIIDVSDHQNPREVGHCMDVAMTFGVEVAGDYAYVGFGNPDYATLMGVVSVSDSLNPQRVGYCGAPGIWWAAIAVSGNYAFLANHEGGLRIIDVSDPQNPHDVAHDSTDAVGVAVSGSHAYVTSETSFHVLDVSNPLTPMRVGSCPLALGTDIAVNGGYAYVSFGTSGESCGVRVIRISNPQNPQEVAHYKTPGYATGIAVGGGYIYIAQWYYGLRVLEFYGAGVEESSNQRASSRRLDPTVLSGASVQSLKSSVIFDAMGRRVLNPRSGVYFVTEDGARGTVRARKIVIQR